MRSNIWQIFSDDPGECPRCAGLQGLQIRMTWVEVHRPPTPAMHP